MIILNRQLSVDGKQDAAYRRSSETMTIARGKGRHYNRKDEPRRLTPRLRYLEAGLTSRGRNMPFIPRMTELACVELGRRHGSPIRRAG
jgi:hypothetical protein